jgi:hypothetical protein
MVTIRNLTVDTISWASIAGVQGFKGSNASFAFCSNGGSIF